MTIVFSFLPFLLLLLSLPASAAERDAVLLRYRLSPGDSCTYDMALATGMALRGLHESAGSIMHTVLVLNVTDTTEPQVALDVDVESMQVSLRGAPGRTDTTVDLAAGRDMQLRTIITRKGDLLFAWPSADLAGAYTTGGRLAGGGIQNALRKVLIQFPDDTLHTGASWTAASADTTALGRGGAVVTQINSRMTFDGFVDTLGVRCARVLLADDSVTVAGTGTHGSDRIAVSGSGSMAGVYYIDAVAGLPVAGAVRTTVDLTFLPDGSSTATAEAVRMHSTSDLTIQRRAADR